MLIDERKPGVRTPYRSPAPPIDDRPSLLQRARAWLVANGAPLGIFVGIGLFLAGVVWGGIYTMEIDRADAARACARTCAEFGVKRWRSEGTRTCRCLGKSRVIIIRGGVPSVVEVEP